LKRAALACALLLGCGPAKPAFPEGFLWGASTAGWQVDMGCPTLSAAECEDENNDWSEFLRRRAELSPGTQAIVTTDTPKMGPGHWELYETDFENLSSLGVNGYRMSIEWSRVFPTATDGATDFASMRALADPRALERYHQMFASLKGRGIQPMVTVNHYTLPTWIHDGVGCHLDLNACSPRGWLDRDRTVREIAKYAGFLGQEFGAEVDVWATENEPIAVAFPGYMSPGADRVNPPGVQFRYQALKDTVLGLIEGHARMYDALKRADTADADGDGQPAFVGLVFAMVPVRAKNPDSRLDSRAAENLFYLYNTVFLDAVVRGDVDEDLDGTTVHRDDLAGRMDWLGINYYTRITVEGTGSASFPDLSPLSTFNPLTIVGWEDYPRGLFEMQLHVHERYGIPSIVTETGTPDLDLAPSWVARYAQWTRRAIAEGADVRGFFFWSLVDNFEWNHGMDMHFGLWAVDKNDPAKTRTERPAADVLRQIARARDIPDSIVQQFPAPK
jgi:beta-galactosidase